MPSLRGRIVKLNGVPVEKATCRTMCAGPCRRERGLTYAATLPRGSRVVAGAWWPADYRGAPQVSMDAGIARGLGLKLGDDLTVDVLGHEMTARLTNLRDIDWASLGINFVMVFSPGSLDGVPQTYIETARATPDAMRAAGARGRGAIPQCLGHRGERRAGTARRHRRRGRRRACAPPPRSR